MHLRLENFDGPLDLLLHLIKVQELSIFNIPIAMIAEQYLSFLRQVPELDFAAAGEFLSMAAQLLEIKANYLLPVLQNRGQEEASYFDQIPDDDPRKNLVDQVLEFELIKIASEFLDQKSTLGKYIFPSNEAKRREEEFSQFEHPLQGNPFDLVIAYERILLKFASEKEKPRVHVRAQKITIQQKMLDVKKMLEEKEKMTFEELIHSCSSRYELIVTLMAVLELCKALHLLIIQHQSFGEIELVKGQKFIEKSFGIEDPEAFAESNFYEPH
ncbi:MAG: segregation/condensation protein A [Silvanigrellaceae bacterium]|nr:segregation/condensation protein A [Silvanigrellaceae bacterium]